MQVYNIYYYSPPPSLTFPLPPSLSLSPSPSHPLPPPLFPTFSLSHPSPLSPPDLLIHCIPALSSI